MADRADVLVVANQTAESDELLEALREREQQGRAYSAQQREARRMKGDRD